MKKEAHKALLFLCKTSFNVKKTVIGIILIICCVVGYGNLYNKFLMPRFVLTSLSLLALFLFAIFSRKTIRVPKSNTFYIYSVVIVLSGLSVIWSVNFGEAVFQVCQSMMGLMVCLAFFNFLADEYLATKKILWISAAIILIVYLLFAIIQLFGLHDTSFVQLYAVTGINAHKNMLSIMLFMLSSFLLTALPNTDNKFLKTIFIMFFGLSIFVIVFLKSRAVILCFIVSTIVFLILYLLHIRKPTCSNRFKIITVIISVVLAFLFFTVLLRYFASAMASRTYEQSEIQTSIASTASLVERFTLWSKTYYVVDKHPFIGCGAGNWQICFPDAGLKGLNRADYWNINFTKPHNEYMGILAEYGYVGLFLFLAFVCSLVVFSGFAIIETNDKKEFIFGAITLSIVCGCCVNAFFDFPNSRIEHVVWMGILYAVLFCFMVKKTERLESKNIGKIGNFVSLVLAVLMVIDGAIRFKGERDTVGMQLALRRNDWRNVERISSTAVSLLYTLDPVGMPLHWYHGQSLKAMGNPNAINSFAKAYNNVPFCKENLNDLGIDEYYTAGNYEQAKFLLHEAIRISPNYIYPYLNLACIYLGENDFRKAKEVIDMVDFDEEKCGFLKSEAGIFEPYNIEAEKQRIDADYDAVVIIRHIIDSLSCKNQE